MTGDLELLANTLERVKWSGPDKFTCSCPMPGHKDKKLSFSVARGNGSGPVGHCFAGCDQMDVFRELLRRCPEAFPSRVHEERKRKYTSTPITVSDLARDKNLPVEFLQSLGLENRPGGILILYRGMDGFPAARQRRRTRLSAHDGSSWFPGEGSPVPYGLDRLMNAREEGFVALVEGESDCWTFWYYGIPALGIPGADMTEKIAAEHLAGIPEVYYWREPDRGGDTFAKNIPARLKEIGYTGKILEMKIDGVKDPNELHKQDPEAFKARFQEAMAKAVPAGEDAKENAKEENSPPKAPPTIEPPAPLKDAAYYGIVGDFVRQLEPHTESDPAAVLTQFLVMYGNMLGRGPYAPVEADRHYTNLFVSIVGDTSKGRKGTSLGPVRGLLKNVDEAWVMTREVSGLSSGEGLIWAVRDPIEKDEPVREGKGKGSRIIEYQSVIIDQGVSDKRLMVVEGELAGAIRVLSRDGSTLSATIRQAWDSGKLRILTKNNPATATDAHISIIGHVTKQELIRYLDATEMGNGFANRFLWVYVKRSKLLPRGGGKVNFSSLISRLSVAVDFARKLGESPVTWDNEAGEYWDSIYPRLSAGGVGMAAEVTSRAEAQVLRLSLVYALLDTSNEIRLPHLLAAEEVWRYCEDSVKYIFGSKLGDPVADKILTALQKAGQTGLTRSEIREIFGRNLRAEEIGRALGILQEQGHAFSREEKTDGRPAARWFAVQTINTPEENDE